MVFAFFSLISSSKTIYSSLGSKTFSIYILHGFLVKALVNCSSFYSKSSNFSVINSLIISIITVLILSGFYLEGKEKYKLVKVLLK